MAELTARRDAYRATVVFWLGGAAGAGIVWRRTTVPTLSSDAAIRVLATRIGAQIEAWLTDDAGQTDSDGAGAVRRSVEARGEGAGRGAGPGGSCAYYG